MTGNSDSTKPEALRPRQKRHPRVTVLGVVGELLITAGVLVGLFLGWQIWLSNVITSNSQTHSAQEQSKKLFNQPQQQTVPSPTNTTDPANIPILDKPADYQSFAVIFIPRLGQGWQRTIRQTVDVNKVLNSYDAGVGHYPSTQMPGEVGNFAVAGHDSGWGNTFINLSQLRVGDKIYIQTKLGWYTYVFRNFQYVQPSAVQVLAAVPGHPDSEPSDRIMTITTCNPPFHAAERLIAFSVFAGYSPLNDVPAEIAALVKGNS